MATFNSSHRVHGSLLSVPKPRLNSLLNARLYVSWLTWDRKAVGGEGERNFFKLDLLLCLYNVIVLALIHSWINRNYWPTSGWLLSIKRKLSFIMNLIISDLMVYDVIFSLSLAWFETKTYANWFRQNFIKVTSFGLTLKYFVVFSRPRVRFLPSTGCSFVGLINPLLGTAFLNYPSSNSVIPVPGRN